MTRPASACWEETTTGDPDSQGFWEQWVPRQAPLPHSANSSFWNAPHEALSGSSLLPSPVFGEGWGGHTPGCLPVSGCPTVGSTCSVCAGPRASRPAWWLPVAWTPPSAGPMRDWEPKGVDGVAQGRALYSWVQEGWEGFAGRCWGLARCLCRAGRGACVWGGCCGLGPDSQPLSPGSSCVTTARATPPRPSSATSCWPCTCQSSPQTCWCSRPASWPGACGRTPACPCSRPGHAGLAEAGGEQPPT